MQLCSSLSILWYCFSLGLEWKLTFSSPVAIAEFSKFAGLIGHQGSTQVNKREGAQLHPSTKNWIKDLLSMALPTRTRPSFPLSHSLPSVSFHKPLILFHQREDSLKQQSQKNNQSDHTDKPQPCLTQWNYELCHVGPPKMDRSWWRVLTKRGPLEKGMANHFSILALRTPWTVWKHKTIGHWKMNSLSQ